MTSRSLHAWRNVVWGHCVSLSLPAHSLPPLISFLLYLHNGLNTYTQKGNYSYSSKTFWSHCCGCANSRRWKTVFDITFNQCAYLFIYFYRGPSTIWCFASVISRPFVCVHLQVSGRLPRWPRVGLRRPLSPLHVPRRTAQWTPLFWQLLHSGWPAGVCLQPWLQRYPTTHTHAIKTRPCTGLFRSCSSNYPTQPGCAFSVLAACRRQVWRVRPGLLREPAGARRALHAVPVQRQHRHARLRLLRRANWSLPQVPAPHRGLRLSALQARLLWQRRRSELPQWVTTFLLSWGYINITQRCIKINHLKVQLLKCILIHEIYIHKINIRNTLFILRQFLFVNKTE